MTALGLGFLTLGVASVYVGCLAGVALSLAGAEDWLILLPAWVGTPFAAGLLVLRAADRLRRPRAESSTALVVAAAAAFIGLAWVGATAALVLSGALG